MLAICAALEWEIRPLLRAMGNFELVRGSAPRMWRGTQANTLVFRTGVGSERAAAATRTALTAFPVTAVINAGCAGALIDDLRVGTVVVPDCIVGIAAAPPVRHLTDPSWTQQLRTAAARTGAPSSAGPILTSSNVIASPAEKRAHHSRFGATAVEMEGAAVAAVAASRGAPFASARVILDTAGTELPPVDKMGGPHGRLAPLKVAAHILEHPRDLAKFVTLLLAVRTAERRLLGVFRALF